MRPTFAIGTFALAVTAGCYSTGEGPTPPDALYFPVGLAVSPGAHALYVINSDFDLQFNGGTVQVYDLDRALENLPDLSLPYDPAHPDQGCPNGHNTAPLLYPGRCSFIDPSSPPKSAPFVMASAQIGAFATDGLVTVQPAGEVPAGASPCSRKSRLFVPVRGEPSLTFFDIGYDGPENEADPTGPACPKNFALDCGIGEGGRCGDDHRAGIDPNDNTRGLTMPPEPFGIAASPDGKAVVVTHQTTGSVSLFTGSDSGTNTIFDAKPTLQFVLSGLPYGATGVAALPRPAYVDALRKAPNGYDSDYQQGFLVTFRSSNEIDLVRFYDDSGAAPLRPYLTLAGATAITVNSSGVDSRGIAVDPTPRRSCEQACQVGAPPSAADLACLKACATTPMPVFVANRAPATLLVGETRTNVSETGTDDLVSIYDSVPASFGASRVVMGNVLGSDGRPHPRVFIVCFDSRRVFIYDPEQRLMEQSVWTGRGPFSLAIDPLSGQDPNGAHNVAYLGHFTDSYIGVIDLDQRHDASYATIIATIGQPNPPRETK